MVVIIGAGISGLALAWYLQKKGTEYLLLEEKSIAGGVIGSVKIGNYLFEKGPNAIMTDPHINQFLEEININDKVTHPDAISKNRFVYKEGKYRKLPASPMSFLFGNYFSWKTKWRLLKEMSLQSKGKPDETIGEFFERRFNKEIVDYAVDPFISGIFAGDPYQLLIDKSFPFLKDMESKHGSVIKGFMQKKSGGSRREAVSFIDGMGTLTSAIAKQVKLCSYNTKVNSIKKLNEGFVLTVTTEDGMKEIQADKIVLSAPAAPVAELLKQDYPSYYSVLTNIQYAPLVKVFLVFNRKDVKHELNGYGGLNPKCENQFVLGTLWNSSINHAICAEDKILLTSMVGGMHNPQNADLPDDEIVMKTVEDIKRYYDISSRPVFKYIHRIPKAIPQYDKNILPVEDMVKQLEEDGIYTCASWYKGAAMSDCIKKAQSLSEKIKVGQTV